jgi:hypothetical protein
VRRAAIRCDGLKFGSSQKVLVHAKRPASALRADERPDPALGASEAIRMVSEHLFDRVCER